VTVELDVRKLRGSLTVAEMALLLGCAPSSVYRWEQQKTPTIDPAQRRILLVLEAHPGDELRGELSRALALRGTLYALYKLLGVHFGP